MRTTVTVLSAQDASEAERWNAFVSRAPSADVYFRPGYSRAYELAGHGHAIALLIEMPEGKLLAPLLLRELASTACALSTPRPPSRDAITAYGYGGLLHLQEPRPSALQAREALREIRQWCLENGVLSALIRLHPLLDQLPWLASAVASVEDFGVRKAGSTFALPLDTWTEEDMSKGRRSDLKFARRRLHVTWSSSTPSAHAPPLPDALRIFLDIYTETMARLQATAFYFFPMEHYLALAQGLEDRLGVAIAWEGAEAVAAALFFADAAFAHYHLSGTTPSGRATKATTLLIRDAVEWARSRGCRYLHLGGGTEGHPSLFEFKRAFGGHLCEYGFLTMVADRPSYDALVAHRRTEGSPPLRPDFFPEYRA